MMFESYLSIVVLVSVAIYTIVWWANLRYQDARWIQRWEQRQEYLNAQAEARVAFLASLGR